MLREEHPMKIEFSSLVSLLGKFIEERFLQYAKADAPISVTLSGNATVVKALQPRKAPIPIEITPSGMVSCSIKGHPVNAESPIFILLFGSVLNVTLASILHPLNASFSISVTLFGMLIALKLKQYVNASFPILVNPSGRSIVDIP